MEATDKSRILNMLREGHITVEEAEELLRALEQAQVSAAPVPLKDARGRKAGHKLRVVVDAGENSQKAKVNVNIPVSLIRTIGPIIAKNLPAEAKQELDKAGVDLLAIMDSIEQLIESGIEEDIVNVDVGEGPDVSKVRVYVE
ncbi:MAG TPA: hypothetical protein VN366_02080 [Feifaniaceae bacterium]|nr:hypothetical protein [Feifaniaceae bacterium]